MSTPQQPATALPDDRRDPDPSPNRVDRPGAAEVSPAERLAFERLLADLSSHFADLPAERVVHEIASAQRRLLDFLDFDRSSFAELKDPDGAFEVLCSVAREGIEPIVPGPPPQLPWYLGQLKAGRMLALNDIPADLPPEAVAEAEYCRRVGLHANLGIPLRVGGRVTGAITLAAFRPTRAWPEDLSLRLKLVGEVFAQALARSRREAELAAALAEVTRLKERLEAENTYLRRSACPGARRALATRSPRMERVLQELAQVAPTQATVLLLGETGTGKEVLADALHAQSGRRERPMIKVNCAALAPSLIEAELFGREKGAYTGALARQMGRFELADGSSLFLDEVGELPLELQSKLLRVLEDGSFERVGGTQTLRVSVRLISATNRDLSQAVAEGRFREDLYYRLNVFPIQVPTLRERREDIALLAWDFVKELGAAMGKPIGHIGDDTMAALVAYPWPGNVRELRNTIERAMILARGPTLEIELPRAPAASRPSPGATLPAPALGPASAAPAGTLAAAERAHVLAVLERTGWRIRGPGGAAERLGLKPTTLESRMQRLGLARPGSRQT